MQGPSSHSRWLKAGGFLGIIILIARITRIPLASIIALLPFLLQYVSKEEEKESPQQGGNRGMTKDEARMILGVTSNETPESIRDAHRRLIQKNHPDLGGSDYLAAKINQARDVLLN